MRKKPPVLVRDPKGLAHFFLPTQTMHTITKGNPSKISKPISFPNITVIQPTYDSLEGAQSKNEIPTVYSTACSRLSNLSKTTPHAKNVSLLILSLAILRLGALFGMVNSRNLLKRLYINVSWNLWRIKKQGHGRWITRYTLINWHSSTDQCIFLFKMERYCWCFRNPKDQPTVLDVFDETCRKSCDFSYPTSTGESCPPRPNPTSSVSHGPEPLGFSHQMRRVDVFFSSQAGGVDRKKTWKHLLSVPIIQIEKFKNTKYAG